MHFCRQPPPRPRLHEGYPCSSAGGPHPTRAFGAPPPPPEGGRGSAWRYQGNSRAWGDAWCATVLWSSPGSPHVLDRGDIATGGGADGEGELVPPPLSPTLQPSYFSPASLARASCRQATHPPLGTPTPPAPAALLPRPQEGAVAVLAISGEQPCPGATLEVIS